MGKAVVQSDQRSRSELSEVRARIEALERIVAETLWMARRYAHGRQSYAVGMYNEASKSLLRLGVLVKAPDGSIFALDGMDDGRGSPGYSGLSPDEFAAAAAALNAKGITPHPDRFSPAGRAEPAADGAGHGG